MKIFCTVFFLLLVLMISGCTSTPEVDFDEMTTVEILVIVIGCNEEQAQHIISTLERVCIGEILDIWPSNQYGWDYKIVSPEGEFTLTVNGERELQAIRGPMISHDRHTLYVNQVISTTDLYPDGIFLEDVVLRNLISSDTERQFYFDISNDIITSIQDQLIIQEYSVDYYGFYSPPSPTEGYEVPESFEFGEWFVSRRMEGMTESHIVDVGIVDVRIVIYSYTEDGEQISFVFDIEFAMLHPISLIMDVNFEEDPQMIYDVWDGEYYDSFHETFDELREASAEHIYTFTEDEINTARDILSRFSIWEESSMKVVYSNKLAG